MSDKADWDRWLKIVAAEGVNLTKFEQDFIESLREQREQGRRLSERQSEILEKAARLVRALAVDRVRLLWRVHKLEEALHPLVVADIDAALARESA